MKAIIPILAILTATPAVSADTTQDGIFYPTATRQTEAEEYTRYELLDPRSASFKIHYEVTAATAGAQYFYNPIRKGSAASDESVYDAMTGKALKFAEVSGADARKDPLMEDADLEKAAELAVLGATKNSGQRCTAVKRILCVEAVADAFAELVLKKTRKLKCGDPMDPSVDVGTVIHEGAAKEFERRVNQAVKDGARLLHGNDRNGALYPPTVVDHVPYTSELVMQETFGPVIPIIRVPNDIESVIRISNATAFGLSSGVCTNRLDYITRFVNELEVGTVNVWEVPGYRIEMSPFGGIKDSGLG